MDTRALFLSVGLALLAPVPGRAQEECENFPEALRSYTEGRIATVFELLEGCRDARSLALLAQAWLIEDEVARARAAVEELIDLDPDFSPGLGDPVGFVRLVAEVKDRRSSRSVEIASVSKTDEPLADAPATVVVVTAEEIERRGYSDLEELLHDLPGFDISRGNGDVYSNVYMRGYRSDRSDRLLFLVDGVEQNDLHSNTAYISRQYPLSNVRQVEVVYGPVSTVYGANAFTGVISVTTKRPAELIEEGKRFGTHVQLASGSFSTHYLDATVAGRAGGLSWSLTGRSYRSAEPDLSSSPSWDYEYSLDDSQYERALNLEGALAEQLRGAAELFCPLMNLCQVVGDGAGTRIELTPAGIEAARQQDQALLERLRDPALGLDDPLRFRDDTDDWAVDAKLDFGGFELGIQTWRREEGTTPWYTELLRSGEGNVWTPRHTAVYGRYTGTIGRHLELTFFSRYKAHELDGDSRVSRLLSFAGGTLDIFDLASGDPLPFFQQIDFDQKSTQLRNELILVYEPSRRFHLVTGVELRNTALQIENRSALRQDLEGQVLFPEQLSSAKADLTDLGVYAQATFRPAERWKLVAGGRIDSGSVRDAEVYQILRLPKSATGVRDVVVSLPVKLRDTGSVFNPRLAVVHTRGNWRLKAVYAEAFKDPTYFQKYTREPGVRQFPNDELRPEKVRNFELHADWQPREDFSFGLVVYEARYSDAVAVKQTVNAFLLPRNSGRFENVGRLRIRGLEATASLRFGDLSLYGSYTYTDPRSIDPTDELGNELPDVGSLRIGDIARHQLHFGLHKPLTQRFELSLRASYVGERPRGEGTTVPEPSLAAVGDFFVVHATVSYEGLLPGARWQLILRNLFDNEYSDPGVQRAGTAFASELPQPGRSFLVRLSLRR